MELKQSALICVLLAFSATASAQVYTDANGLQWEKEVREIIVKDDQRGVDVNVEDERSFDEDVAEKPNLLRTPGKTRIDHYNTETCQDIIRKKDLFPKHKISKTTQYYTPTFEPGPTGFLQKKDRKACIRIEGSCIVGSYLYNWLDKKSPWGKRYDRNDVPFKFGRGNGQSYYNSTNSLDPCRTVAADLNHYPTGTVLFMPSLAGKICPQTGKPVDGCFVVGDIGGAIKGKGRFDMFTGECANYNSKTYSCMEPLAEAFSAQPGDEFYVVGRHNMLAKELREKADLHIRNEWRSSSILWPRRW